MSDNTQGGVPGIDPAGIPAGLFTPEQKEPEFVELRFPPELQGVVALIPQENGLGLMLTMRPGSTLTKEQVADALHGMSHQMLEEVNAEKEAAAHV